MAASIAITRPHFTFDTDRTDVAGTDRLGISQPDLIWRRSPVCQNIFYSACVDPSCSTPMLPTGTDVCRSLYSMIYSGRQPPCPTALYFCAASLACGAACCPGGDGT